MIPLMLLPVSIFYQPGQQTTASSRLTPTTIMNAVNLTSNTAQNSSSVDTNNVPKKSLKITLTTGLGTISDYMVKITALSSQADSGYAEIVSEYYEANGTYHWYLEDVARYFMVQAQSLGTADGSNYVTVTVGLEGIS